MNSTVRPIFNEKVTEKWNLWTHKQCTNILFTKDQGCVWIELIFVETENWKHCSKIIFKCVNSIVGPIFNEKVTEKWNLWVRKQYIMCCDWPKKIWKVKVCDYCLLNINSKCWLSAMNSARMHYSRTHKLHFSVTFSLKMGPTVLFTHLKIILL